MATNAGSTRPNMHLPISPRMGSPRKKMVSDGLREITGGVAEKASEKDEKDVAKVR